MDTDFMACLVMTLFSAVVCIGFPRVLTLIGFSTLPKSLQFGGAAIKPAKSDSSQSTAYSELTTVNN